jgi:hypothetical protein
LFGTEHGEDLVAQKFQNLADSGLDGAYEQVYKFIAGFIKGASFSGNIACQSDLTGLAYYGLSVYEHRQAYLPWETMKASIALQKFTEKYNLFGL